MKKLLVAAGSLLLLLLATPMLAAAVITMASEATATCDPDPAAATRTILTAGPDTIAALTTLRLAPGEPPLTTDQASNAITIAQVAERLGVPRYGLQIAVATAIQESHLHNLAYGDRDSLGLFQQRPSTGWGTPTQVMDPLLASEAFFGRAEHTNNPGLLDIPHWQQLPLATNAQTVQGSAHPDAYTRWSTVAGQIADLLTQDPTTDRSDATNLDAGAGTDLDAGNDPASDTSADLAACRLNVTTAGTSLTVATLNLLGAGHTDDQPGGGHDSPGFAGWASRLPGEMNALDGSGASIVALQEVHTPQAQALTANYASRWAAFPATGPSQNKILWDPTVWTPTAQQFVDVPYFGGRTVGMPLVHLTSGASGHGVWVLGLHNPADTRGDASSYRLAALHQELTAATGAAATGDPVVVLGDFNDAHDSTSSSHCVLTPTLTDAFADTDPVTAAAPAADTPAAPQADSVSSCRSPAGDAAVDHIYGVNLTWVTSSVDHHTETQRLSDHPLVTATAATGDPGCATDQHSADPGGSSRPDALEAETGPTASPSRGPTANSITDPLAVAIGAPANPSRRRRLDAPNAPSTSASTRGVGSGGVPVVRPGGDVACAEVVYPVPAAYITNDAHNWGARGDHWDSWHTGTDFGAPCGTPVYAAHAGTVEIDSTQAWAGPNLIRIVTGADSVATWYAHMQQLKVSGGETVRPGQQIGMVGDLGNAEGCHLHFEVHLHNGSIYGPDNVDPSDWLRQHAHISES